MSKALLPVVGKFLSLKTLFSSDTFFEFQSVPLVGMPRSAEEDAIIKISGMPVSVRIGVCNSAP